MCEPRPAAAERALRIAILEDDPDQLALLRRWLAHDGHDVHGFASGRELMTKAVRESFDLFVLDWQVPDVPGIEVLKWLRGRVSREVPVLFVTVRDSEQDIVFALEAGADDYIVKPPRQAEFVARVHALLRRAYPRAEEPLLSFPPFEIDLRRGEIRRDGRPIALTPKEFELAATLFGTSGGSFRAVTCTRPSGGEAEKSRRAPWTRTSANCARSSTCAPRAATAWCPFTTTGTGWKRCSEGLAHASAEGSFRPSHQARHIAR